MKFFNDLKDTLSSVVKETPTIRATMMGPRAVGKTSIMASIFSETRDSIAGTNLYFRSSIESLSTLSNKRLALMQIFEKKETLSDAPNVGAIAASNEETKFVFEMGYVGRQKSVNIEITDFPGEYLQDNPQKVADYIADSQVIMIAIDTPYLMEKDGQYNEEKNHITWVTNFIVNHSNELKDKLILFVPLKCERYFHDGKIDDVQSRIEREYTTIISFCNTANIACAIVPIQTLGGVEFDSFIDNTNSLSFITKLSKYRFVGADAEYKPLFCVQPMYYLLVYVANYYAWANQQSSNAWEGFKNSLYSFLKNDKDFLVEIKKLSKNMLINKMGYKILHTNTILK